MNHITAHLTVLTFMMTGAVLYLPLCDDAMMFTSYSSIRGFICSIIKNALFLFPQ